MQRSDDDHTAHTAPPDDARLVEGPRASLQRLADIVATLRAPHGCPWDRAQTHDTLARFAIEEAYEVVDAIDAGALDALRGELGDLLLQVVLHAQIAHEDGRFDLQDVIDAISDKMLRRHPHVFGDADAEEVLGRWEQTKQEQEGRDSLLAGVPRHLPALMRADQLTRKAARVGFDWDHIGQVLDKIDEELAELREALGRPEDDARRIDEVEEELGDLLFAVSNLARKLELDSEAALRATLDKFDHRFRHIERALRAQGRHPRDASLDEMEALWQEAKTLPPSPQDDPHGS